MSDCVLDERTAMDEEAAHWRAEEYFKLKEINLTDTQHCDDLVLPTAYGWTGLGLPTEGFMSQYQDISYYGLNEFRKNIITPDRMIICASGVKSHDEFVYAAAPYYVNLKPNVPPKRTPTAYIGGEQRIMNESDQINFFYGFPTVGWNSKDHAAVHVLKSLVGSGGGFSSGGPGKGMHSRSLTHFLMQYGFIESVKAVYHDFSDAGIFGIQVVGMAEYADYVGASVFKEFANLIKLTDEEVERAKKLLKAKILITMEKSIPRLEEATKTYAYTGLLPD
jgi:processing peptidase subunit alpha